MNQFPFRNDQKLIDIINESEFTVSAEIIPPRNGTEQSNVLKQISSLVNAGAQFLSVTKGAGGSLRGGSLPIAQVIKDQFNVPCIAHFTCRDLIPVEVENQLMDHHYFGIRNILALRGDPPAGQPEWKARVGGYNYAYQLIEQIRNLNKGKFLKRPDMDSPTDSVQTDFCIGAAAYPEHPDENERLEFFKLKVQNGAEYGITDLIYDANAYERFLELLDKGNCRVPILPGSRILTSQEQAERMMKRFPIQIPKPFFNALPSQNDPDAKARGVELFLELVEDLKRRGAPGIHLYVIGNLSGALKAVEGLKSQKKTRNQTQQFEANASV